MATALVPIPARRRVALAILLLFAAMMAAMAVGRTTAAQRYVVTTPVPPRVGMRSSSVPSPDHERAAPAAGTTGTIALPGPSTLIDDITSNAPLAAASPFRTGGASATDRARALECLTAAIYYEAASEPDAGQRAVAQVVLNRVRHPAFPATVCGVVYQGSERRGCQFSFACDGSMARSPSRSEWARAARNAAAALAGGVYAAVGLATHYHTFAVTPAWNRELVMTGAVGAHFFHRWRGWWGTAAAFRPRYVGHEPAPGPHIPIGPTTPAGPITPMPDRVPDVIPAVAESGTPLAPAPVEDRLPPASDVLARWKDSGKPLR